MADLAFDLSQVPLSRRGNWLSLSRPTKPEHRPLGPGWYLRSNHARPFLARELFKLELVRGGRKIAAIATASPDGVRFQPKTGRGHVEIVFDSGNAVRVRGTGLGIRFRTGPGGAWPVVVYADGPDAWVVNLRAAFHRYRFERIRGRLTQRSRWSGETTAGAVIEAGGSGAWEVAIDEFESTYIPRRRQSFDRVRQGAGRGFAAFARKAPPVPARWAEARRLAAYVLWSCTQSPAGQLAREPVFMSINWMDGVWSWDYLFNTVALAGMDPGLAFDQVRLLSDHQDAHGAYPDYLGDLFKHYNFSKPPVQGILFAELERRVPAWFTAERARVAYESTARFTRWWLDHRRWPGSDLCHYLHGNDSGWDNSSILHRGSPLIAPDLNAFLAVQARWLADFGTRHALIDPAAARAWERIADRIERALIARLWDRDQFVGIKLPEREPVRASSLVDCMPIVLGRRLDARIAAALIARIRKFLCPAGLATELRGSPFYTADGYWRGPVWGPSTFLIVLGLVDLGETGLAAEIARRFCETCALSGFAENFDAWTRKPLRDPAYTWTAACFLLLAERKAEAGVSEARGRRARRPKVGAERRPRPGRG